MLACLLLCTTALHAQEPYAVLSEDNTVLTFYYDTHKAERDGMSVGPFEYVDSPTSAPTTSWYGQRSTITTIVFDASFADCTSLTSTSYWFFYCTRLTTITGIENLKTDNVTDMSYMFYGCSGLTTVYAGDGWSTEKVTSGSGIFMFFNCRNLVGGEGTVYDPSHIDYTYARIDGGTDAPGYFTYKAPQPSLKGDVNGDQTVDVADIASVLSCMAGNGTLDKAVADVNGDGTVDVADIATIISEMAARARRLKIEN